MLNERKVKLMTRLAIYEKNEGRHTIPLTKYFTDDFVSWNMIKTVVAITFAYFLGVAIWVLYNIEEILENIATLNYFEIIRYALLLYIILLVGYIVISYIAYRVKYYRAMKSLGEYEKGLKALAKIHMEEVRRREELGGKKES